MTTGVDDDHDDDQDYCDDDDKIREGFRKITRIFMVFYHTGGREAEPWEKEGQNQRAKK